jgi:hypothetical protein
MAISAVSDIENAFASLPPEVQLDLLERLVHRARLAVTAHPGHWESELAAMAADPDVQRELREIRAEFSIAEPDGLEG